jgi:hypothetical protein
MGIVTAMGGIRSGAHAPRRPLTVIPMCGLVLLAVVAGAAPAGAATEQQTYSLTGTILIGPPPALTLPSGSTFTATIDTTTGAITNGHVSIPTFNRGAVSGPQADITVTDAAPATGTLDLTTGAATLTNSFLVSLSIPSLTAVCTLGPLNVTTSTSGGGSPLSGDPPTATLTATGFTVPAVVVSPTCSSVNAGLVNGFLGLPTEATSISLTVVHAQAAPAPTVVVPAAPTVEPAFTG